MSHRPDEHEWSAIYDHRGTSYRDCTTPGCGCHQQWVCAMDQWSTFDSASPRQREAARMEMLTDREPAGHQVD